MFYAPFDVVLSRFDVVEPDLLYLSNERAAQALTDKKVQGVPNLVVEILSKGTRRRDETLKLQLYERSGVDEYWLVDPERASIRVHRLVDDHFAVATDVSAADGDSVRTPLLPDLVVVLAEIFAPGPR